MKPTGETNVRNVPGDGGEPASGAVPAAGESGSGTTARPEMKPAAAATTTTTVTKSSVTKTAKPKAAATTTVSPPRPATPTGSQLP